MINAITGADDHLITYLEQAMKRAKSIRMIVAFVMESGVKIILPHLLTAADRGVRIKLLTGRYLSVTEPSALYYLIDKLGVAIDIRFYKDSVRSFHPKTYIFDYDADSEIFVGSSNLSLSALTSGIEWNYRFFKSEHPADYNRFSNMFDELYHHCAEPVTPEILKEYALGWKKPNFLRKEQKIELVAKELKPEPHGAQIEALYYLKQARLEGVDKGLVVAATGVGKTYLAAFDALNFEKVLFLAHREEILQQAYDTFGMLRPESNLGFYTGVRKDEGADIYFSTVQTLSREDNLKTFSPESFEYIIVDEFHHAVADSYRRVIEYFRPSFLLGLTATPFRMDNKDLFALCDDNILYEISLKQAIERDLLVPFRYYAIYDPTDYDQVRVANGRYVVDDLERELSHESRADIILKNYLNMAGERTLAFCVSIKHAEYMAKYFSQHGIKAVAVHSSTMSSEWTMNRFEAIKLLQEGALRVIFAVDIFNEGVDIPTVDTVMFLRPTESYVVFLQQLGRGLRKHEYKEFLTVIDFIGNYKRAHYIPLLLAGESPWTTEGPIVRRVDDLVFPDGCQVNFDFRIIDLFEEMAARDPLPTRMRDTYWRLKQIMGRRPTRVDIYQGSDVPIREFLRDGWLRFLQSVDELDAEELDWLGTPAEEFLVDVEKTRMTKAYKMPTIMSFVQDGTLVSKVALKDIGYNLMRFYRDHSLHQKDMKDRKSQRWREWELKDFMRAAKDNPVKFLSRGRFFHYDEVNQVMYLDKSLEPYLSPQLAAHIEDILNYRRIDYFRKRFKN